MTNYYKIFTAKAPVNIAVIKYWGKSNGNLKVPINDSLSGTLSISDMCATTSVAICDKFESDELWLNGTKQNIDLQSQAGILLARLRSSSNLDKDILNYKVHIVSYNNFPTAAGLASSAAGYACLAFVLGHVYGIDDRTELSKLARLGSGSACRSLFGGFVHWEKGHDHDSSKAKQVADQNHWPSMRVVICVINDQQKEVSSSKGMALSVETSDLIKYRAERVVPERIEKIRKAILSKDFETFAEITMKDSNQFHAICLDTFAPIFYLNEASRHIIKMCTIINELYGKNKVAYTFDAGPNACIYVLDDFVEQFINVVQKIFPAIDSNGSEIELTINGKTMNPPNSDTTQALLDRLYANGVGKMPNSLRYLINTSIGDGPKLVEDHVIDPSLKP